MSDKDTPRDKSISAAELKALAAAYANARPVIESEAAMAAAAARIMKGK